MWSHLTPSPGNISHHLVAHSTVCIVSPPILWQMSTSRLIAPIGTHHHHGPIPHHMAQHYHTPLPHHHHTLLVHDLGALQIGTTQPCSTLPCRTIFKKNIALSPSSTSHHTTPHTLKYRALVALTAATDTVHSTSTDTV